MITGLISLIFSFVTQFNFSNSFQQAFLFTLAIFPTMTVKMSWWENQIVRDTINLGLHSCRENPKYLFFFIPKKIIHWWKNRFPIHNSRMFVILLFLHLSCHPYFCYFYFFFFSFFLFCLNFYNKMLKISFFLWLSWILSYYASKIAILCYKIYFK